jgi:hypothetical protein
VRIPLRVGRQHRFVSLEALKLRMSQAHNADARLEKCPTRSGIVLHPLWNRCPTWTGIRNSIARRLHEFLGRAYREGRLDRRLRIYLAPKVLIIDEMGCLPLDDLGATISFQLVSARYERGSIILTSNKSYGEWGSLFGDPIIATAILDRLLHHSTTVNIRGESYRLKERRKACLLPLPEQHPEDPRSNAAHSSGKRKI